MDRVYIRLGIRGLFSFVLFLIVGKCLKRQKADSLFPSLVKEHGGTA